MDTSATVLQQDKVSNVLKWVSLDISPPSSRRSSEELDHSASFDSVEKNAPSKAGAKQLGDQR